MKKIILTAIAGSLISLSAAAVEGNPCTQIHVQIANLRAESCTLISSSVYNPHGVFVTPPPIAVESGSSKQFVMRQSFFGPEIQLSYRCGNKIVSFSTQQNKSILWSGSIHSGIDEQLSDKGINATHTSTRGSCLWRTTGQSNWTIS